MIVHPLGRAHTLDDGFADGYESTALVEAQCAWKFVEITPYLNQPQVSAAKRIGIPTSTLSKRWKEAVRDRKWPYRSVRKLDKEINTLLHNHNLSNVLPPDVERALGVLLRRRQDELRPVVIRL